MMINEMSEEEGIAFTQTLLSEYAMAGVDEDNLSMVETGSEVLSENVFKDAWSWI